ncbi:MAG: ATP-binding protein [Actinomycetota bacterium]
MRTKSVERSFRSTPAALRAIRDFIRQKAKKAHLNSREAEDFVLAVSEAATNAVVHADTSEILVAWTRSGARIEICVADRGVFKHRIPTPERTDVGGRGIPIMVALMDDVTLSPGTQERPGTVIRLTKHLRTGTAGAHSPPGGPLAKVRSS